MAIKVDRETQETLARIFPRRIREQVAALGWQRGTMLRARVMMGSYHHCPLGALTTVSCSHALRTDSAYLSYEPCATWYTPLLQQHAEHYGAVVTRDAVDHATSVVMRAADGRSRYKAEFIEAALLGLPPEVDAAITPPDVTAVVVVAAVESEAMV
jgi:hypothetical protein